MAHHTLRTVLVGGALVVALTLAGPAPAHAAAGPGTAGLWSWLAGLWDAGPATGQAQGEHRHAGTAMEWEKAGSCVDPNGCLQTLGTAPPECRSRNEAGVCLNPRG